MTNQELLAGLAAALAGGGVRVVDLTQPLRPSTPVIQLPPPLAPSQPFRIEEIARYDERGPAWYWNNFSCGEHTGTHFDAPAHWITGRELPNAHTDTIPPQFLLAPACVVDCTAQVAASPDFLLEPPDIQAWEAEHGLIPAGSWVLMRTGWSEREDPEAFLNAGEDGPHVPGPSVACMRFLVEQRDIRGWGVEFGRHRRRPGLRVRAAVPGPQSAPRRRQARARKPVPPRPAPTHGGHPDHPAAQDRGRVGQPVAGAGAGGRMNAYQND